MIRRAAEEAVMLALCVLVAGIAAVGYLFPPSRAALVARIEDHLERLEGDPW